MTSEWDCGYFARRTVSSAQGSGCHGGVRGTPKRILVGRRAHGSLTVDCAGLRAGGENDAAVCLGQKILLAAPRKAPDVLYGKRTPKAHETVICDALPEAVARPQQEIASPLTAATNATSCTPGANLGGVRISRLSAADLTNVVVHALHWRMH